MDKQKAIARYGELHAEITVYLNRCPVDPQLFRFYQACLKEMATIAVALAKPAPTPRPAPPPEEQE